MENMKIIYLDQFIVSELADSQTDDWKEIRQILEELASQGKICCPLSMEHYLESSTRNEIDALKNDRLLNVLSNGKCFYIELYITTFLINAFVKEQPYTLEMYIGDAIKNFFDDNTKIENYRRSNQQYKNITSDRHMMSNEIKTIARSNKVKSPLNSPLYGAVKNNLAREFVKRMVETAIAGHLIIRGEKTNHGDFPSWIDLILEYLLRHFKFTPEEMIKLFQEVYENGFNNIPTVDILTSLEAYQSILHKKITPNDEIDNLRIACGLPISYILFTDKKRKAEIQELGLDSKYKCKVLHGATSEISLFKKYLSEIN